MESTRGVAGKQVGAPPTILVFHSRPRFVTHVFRTRTKEVLIFVRSREVLSGAPGNARRLPGVGTL
jgi:hypothetical protein